MYCTKKITDELIWVGGNDRKLTLFEGVYSVPYGVSYNAYLLKAEKTILFDTVDKAEVLASKLNDNGVKVTLYDTSITPASEILSECFKYSNLVIASTTYNAGIFVQMESFIQDLVAHNFQNRTVAILENGSWAPTVAKLVKEAFEKCKNISFIEKQVTIKSSLKPEQIQDIEELANEISKSMAKNTETVETTATSYDENSLFKLSYGLFVLTAKGEKDNGCIINTVTQVANNPTLLTISVNKQNFTHDLILSSKKFNVSILSEEVPFSVFEHFGFSSGKNTDKFKDFTDVKRSNNGLYYLTKFTNAYISCNVIKTEDCGSHTLFTATIEGAEVLSDTPSVTYAYYFEHIKPKPIITQSQSRVWVCKYCGYNYNEDTEKIKFEDLPSDWVCPLCKHPKSDFELQ